MFDTQDKTEDQAQQAPVSESSSAQDGVSIPVQRLLQQYRYHLDALQELTAFLGAAAVSEFGDALHELARTVRPPSIATRDSEQATADAASGEPLEQDRPEIQAMIRSVLQNPDAIRRMSNLPEVVLIAAVDRMGTAIRHIPNPSEAVQMAAVKRNPWAIKRIKRPTEQVLAYALERAPELKHYFERISHSRRSRLSDLAVDSDSEQQ